MSQRVRKNYDNIALIRTAKFSPFYSVARLDSGGGFAPEIVVDPHTDMLETVTLEIRSCFTIEAHTNVDIQIWRTGQRKDNFNVRHRNFNSILEAEAAKDSTVPNVMGINGVQVGERVCIPLSIMLSNNTHLLFIKDSEQNQWRAPIPLTRSFLWNFGPAKSSAVDEHHIERCIQIKCDRLTRKPTASEIKRNQRHQSALDTTIHILPSVLLSNSTPLRLKYRCWQHHSAVKSGVGLNMMNNLTEGIERFIGLNDSNDSDDDEPSGIDPTPMRKESRKHSHSNNPLGSSLTKWGGGKLSLKDIGKKVMKAQHIAKRTRAFTAVESRSMKRKVGFGRGNNSRPFFSTNTIEKGMDVKLVGVNMKEDLFISISRGDDDEIGWSKPMKLDMKKFASNKRGDEQQCSLGPDLDIEIAMSVGRNSKRRCTIFSPDWIINKTGMALQYKLSGRDGTINSLSKGDLPIMVKSGKGRHVMCIPVSEPQQDNLERYWDKEDLGDIKIIDNMRFKPDVRHMTAPTAGMKSAMKTDENRKEVIVDWSNQVGFDNVGTTDELRCGNLLLGVSTDTMTGVFVSSNICTFWPRFVVQNSYPFDLRVIPLSGPHAVVVSTLDSIKREEVSRLS